MSDINSTVTNIYSKPQVSTSNVKSGNTLPPAAQVASSTAESVQNTSAKEGVEVSLQSQSIDQTGNKEISAEQEGNEALPGDTKDVKEAVAKLNDYVQTMERKLEFEMDDDSGLTVIKVFDKESAEMIRQLPSEEALTLARSLNKSEPLVLFSAQV